MTKTGTYITSKLFEFIEVLRDAGIIVSVDEVLSVFSAVPEIDLYDKQVFRQALKTTIVKDHTDIPVFDKCFEEFFTGRERFFDNLDADLAALTGGSQQQMISEISNMLDKYLETLDSNIVLEKNPDDIMRMFLEELPESSSGGGGGMALFKTKGAIGSSYTSLAEDGEEREIDPDELMELLRSMMNLKLQKRRIGKQITLREEYLLNRKIYQLSPDEIKEMRELVNRFGQKLKNRISLRKKRVKHGGIDIKRTLRTNMQYGAVPFKLFYKNRKIDRPQLVVMCDVSRSVNQYSHFMLLLTYSLQGLFSKVRTFAFISSMVEITDLFREMDPEVAINSMFTDTNFTYGWGSNYGRCFDMFMEDYSDALTRKTSVLILGDARNNDNDPGLESFKKISERSRNVFWLNPDRRHLWDWNDSIASLYKNFCNEMKEVNNFLDLSEFIDKLFIDMY
jgi:hypothetical protein